jgi:hypothetical protein
MRAELEKSGRISEIALQIREHKAADRVIAKATISDVPAEEWNKEYAAKSGTAGIPATAGKPSAKGKKS